jgi:predicted  nucleic acid-binding Zn-ribbon protein
MEQFLTVSEHKEYAKRMDDEHKRQNHRIDALEKATAENNKLLVSVEKLAINMENMQREQAAQREEIEEIKSRDGNKWREVVKYVVVTFIGVAIGYITKQLGL